MHGNKDFPNKPSHQDGWVLPNRIDGRIKDIVRTWFVVKYLDGVEFLADKTAELARAHHVNCDISHEAREEGYYAYHLNIHCPFEIPTLTWETERITVPVEFQVWTQLQEDIRKLLHEHYERRRVQPDTPASKWQWDYRSDEFATNYLGHILHYVEGMIVDIREKQRGQTSV